MEGPQKASCLSTQPASRQSKEPEDTDGVGPHGLPGVGAVLPEPLEPSTHDHKEDDSHRSPDGQVVGLDSPTTGAG